MLELMYSKYDLRELLLAIKITRFYNAYILKKKKPPACSFFF